MRGMFEKSRMGYGGASREGEMRRYLTIVTTALALAGAFGTEAHAEKPTPTGETPSLYGAATIPRGRTAIGLTVGYPSLRPQFVWGVRRRFDVGFIPAMTYGRNHDGYRQDLGLNLEIPLRWAFAEGRHGSFGMRIMPYFRIGEAAPAFSVGGNIGFRVGIAFPRIFTLIFGPEGRVGFASIGSTPNRQDGLDAELTGMVGLESFIHHEWIVSLEMHFGHEFGAGQLADGALIVRGWVGFGYVF